MRDAKRHYLIVAPADVMSLVAAQSLFMTLKKKHPESVLDVIADESVAPLLQRMPEVDHVLTMPFGYNDYRLISRYRLGRKLCDRYDEAIVIPLSLRSALIPAFAGIPVRTGWLGQMRYGLLNDIRLLNNKRNANALQQLNALAEPAGAPLADNYPSPRLNIDRGQFEVLRARFDFAPDKPVLALCLGLDGSIPKQDYRCIVEGKIDQGWQVWLLGSAKDRVLVEDTVAGLSDIDREKCFNLAGQISLTETVDLLAMTDEVVSLDAGLRLIAEAVGKLPILP